MDDEFEGGYVDIDKIPVLDYFGFFVPKNMTNNFIDKSGSDVNIVVNGSLGSEEDIEKLKIKISEEIEKYIKRI